MRKILLLLAIVFTGFAAQAQSKNDLNLIPVPAKMKINTGQFVINSKTTINLSVHNKEMQDAVAVFSNLLRRTAGLRLQITTNQASSNAILCKINPSISNYEGYKLSVQKDLIVVEAKTPNGIFYAMQTLRQLLPFQIERPYLSNTSWVIPCLEIEDEPRFAYRGLMLDVCRYFMPKEFVLKFIDMLAYHKMNTFHWHLTNDQGWRIEIKQYPKLTQVGAFRNRTLEGRYYSFESNRNWNNTRYGGFYTQAEIKEVIEYAKRRFVTVIPEIEMPGHALAALASYPQYSCTGGPFQVEGSWGVFNDIFCPKEETFTFLQNILTEVIDLFPSQYIHIGGDEAPKLRWKNCAHCQALIKKEGLKDEHELQSYFTKRIEKFVGSKGRRIIGWDEILEGGLAPNATVMSWRGEAGGIETAKQHHDVIMSPTSYFYLDYYQADPRTEPMAMGGSVVPLWRVYSYNPIPASLTPHEASHIIGVQGNVWTEYISTPEHAEYMAFPRGAAVAEIGWSPQSLRNYPDFKQRVVHQFKRYDGIGWKYCDVILKEIE